MNTSSSGMKLPIIISLVAVSFVAGWFLVRDEASNIGYPGPSISVTPSATPTPTLRPSPTPGSSQRILFSVPFTAQAPFGNWSDPRQQDGCEEASALMAMHWVRGTNFTLEEALEEILAISAYEQSAYGGYHDTSAEDTVDRIFNGYYKYSNARAESGIELNDIKEELANGNLVIIPANGRLLGNPNFTPPGPERHMLVIKGYDPSSKEFITNDPGTRQGKDYKYNEDVLFTAIRDYTTGYHEPTVGIKKSMVVVSR